MKTKQTQTNHKNYIGMVLRSKAPMPKVGWKLVPCAICSRECWEPEFATSLIQQGAEAFCMDCALMKSGWTKDMRV